MGYKWEHRDRNNKHRMNLLNRWMEVEEKSGWERIRINEAGTGELEVYCERMARGEIEGEK